MDPITIATLISTGLLLIIEIVKLLNKQKFKSTCCNIESSPQSNKEDKHDNELSESMVKKIKHVMEAE